MADTWNAASMTAVGNLVDSFAVIHNLENGRDVSFEASSKGLTDFKAHLASPKASILFLRGFASPEWLNTIGQTHGASAEFYRRHLEFPAFALGGRDLYLSPSLPSSCARIFQLTIPTICIRNVGVSGYEPEDLQKDRQREAEAMNRYFKQLRSKAKVADSVVRRCLLLSKQEYVLEQTVSIEVGPSQGTWHAIVWLDQARDLSQSFHGPWNPAPGTRAWETFFYPVIVQQAGDSPSQPRSENTRQPNLVINAGSSHVRPNSTKPEEEWRAAQNICLMPFQYGSRLDKDLASRDTLYALTELFQFAASAEAQFLNFCQKRIEHELSFVGTDNVGQYHSVSLLNLNYIKSLLTSHGQGLAETIGILKNRRSLDWPRVDKNATAEKAAVLLLADFEFLFQRVGTLARDCEQGMATLANSSVLEESRRSANTATRVQRLTVIATIFIPLSFVCSIWGTNFEELGSGTSPMWMLLMSAVPVIMFSYLIYNWEMVLGLYRKITSKSKE
ncbi:MAG: hypothetical protein Q9198_000260, partial [Flavoplaca austrocitrina]